MKVLIKQEAEELVFKRLSKNTTAERQFQVLRERTIEKPFGWVFFYEIVTGEQKQNIRPLIVNKHSGQVIGNSTEQPVESIIKTYEKLLAERKSIAEGWCLTLNPLAAKTSRLKELAEKTKNAGFYEINE